MAKTVITYGTFDLFHEGHLNILKSAKALGDYLIVGVTSENYDRERGKLNVIQSTAERIENVRKTGLADLIIVEEYEGQKIEDIQKYKVDIFAIGSDWKGKFDYLKEYCQVVYLPRTKGVSSTDLRNNKFGIVKIGIVGYGRIAQRFLEESKFVSSHNVEAVFGPNKEEMKVFAEKNEILYFTDNYDEFLRKVDAVYIASPHHTHYSYAKKALLEGKHVLCEKPLCFSRREAEELFEIADKNKLVLLEAIKTAFMPAFQRLIATVKTGKIGQVFEVDATFTKLISDETRELNAVKFAGSFAELISYPLLAIVKMLGTNYRESYFFPIYNDSKVDIYTKLIVKYDDAIGTGTVGLKGKKEGDLVISGSKGYVYVPSPWWLTEYFEIRDDNGNIVERISDKFHGHGLRYELAEFLRLIHNSQPETFKLRRDEILTMVQILEKFFSYQLLDSQ